MAIVVDRNSIYSKLRGRVGDLIFKQYKDKTVVTKIPDMENVKPTVLQKLLRKQFATLSPLYQQFIRQEGNREMLEKEMLAAGKRRLFQFFISKYYKGAKKVAGVGWVVEEVTLPVNVGSKQDISSVEISGDGDQDFDANSEQEAVGCKLSFNSANETEECIRCHGADQSDRVFSSFRRSFEWPRHVGLCFS